MNTHDDNDMLSGDDDLKALYRSLPRKEPSPALDSAIKRAAADAVRPRHSLPRWPIAVASTAVIVVAGALGWRVAQQPSAPAHSSSSQLVAASQAPQAPPALTTAPVTDRLDAAPSLATAPAALAARETQHENIRSAMKAKVVAPVAHARQTPVAIAESAPVVAMNEAAAPAPAPAAPAPQAYALQAGRSSVASAEPQMAMKAMVMPTTAPQRDATAIDTADTPDQELAKIRELFALHHHDEALQRLAAFQKAHPDVPLPDDLRTQLPGHE